MNGLEINREIDKLFDAHEKAQPSERLVRDGIIDPEKWDDTKHRIVFLLKERNLNSTQLAKLEKDEIYDFRISCRRGSWKTLGLWAYALLTLGKGEKPLFKDAQTNHRSALHATAILNMKKTPGLETSTTSTILEGGQRFKDILSRQLELLNPNVVICGGKDETYFLAEKVLGHLRPGRWINFYHPSCRLGHEFTFNELVKCVLTESGNTQLN